MSQQFTNITPPGVHIFKQNPHKQWVKDNLYFVQLQTPLKFEEEQQLFYLGWKKIGVAWVYNLIYAYIIGEKNEEVL